MNILITGTNGQLGSEIRLISRNYTHNFFFEGSESLDVTDAYDIDSYIIKNNIQLVINCAAYTAVDKAENYIKKATAVNVNAVKNIVKSLEKVGGKLIHISTDYVFNGQNCVPYKENDEVSPLGIYGKTKRAGEEVVLNSEIEAIIIRTSWLYSSFGNNFMKTMLRLGNEKDSINVVADQIGLPTYARDLAEVCLKIASSNHKIDKKSKIYHFANEGIASWYDFAKAIIEYTKLDCKVKPIETKDFSTVAKRPNYSVLNTNKIKTDFDITIPYWRDSLKEVLEIVLFKS